MKTERIDDIENEQESVFYATLEEALKAKLERTEQAMNKLSPAARARLIASSKRIVDKTLSDSGNL